MELIDHVAPEEYLRFVQSRPEANFLQSPLWGDVHHRLGQPVIYCGVRQSGRLAAVAMAIVKSAKRGRYLEVPGGPLADYSQPEVVAACGRLLRQIAQRHRCSFVRVRPQLEVSTEAAGLIQPLAARKAPMHLHAEHTTVIDLAGDTEQLLAAMRRQTRYEVRRVAKRQVNISWTAASQAAIDEFYDLQIETAKRHHFVQSSRQFLRTLGQVFGSHVRVYRAEKNGQLLNVAVVLYWDNEAVYFEAASTVAARREPGAYGIVWQVMQDMRQQGCQRLNLWGIAYSNDPHHRYAGVTTFKRGFGGRDITFVAAQDLVVNRLKYKANWIVETIRRKKRGL